MLTPAQASLAANEAVRATVLVQKLTSSKEELKNSLPRGTDSMPPAELHFASGLAFTFSKKGGIGVSLETGHGFVINKIASKPASPAPGERAAPHPAWSWSAPLFISTFAGGVGLTLGYSEIESVIVLDTSEAVQSFTKAQVAIDADVTGAAGSSIGTHLPATAANLSHVQLSDKTFTFSVCKGVMVDVSITGLHFDVDEKLNEAFYGIASPAAVLDGTVDHPPPFQELYEVLDKILTDYYSSLRGLEVSQEQQGAVAVADGCSSGGDGSEVQPAAPEQAPTPASRE